MVPSTCRAGARLSRTQGFMSHQQSGILSHGASHTQTTRPCPDLVISPREIIRPAVRGQVACRSIALSLTLHTDLETYRPHILPDP